MQECFYCLGNHDGMCCPGRPAAPEVSTPFPAGWISVCSAHQEPQRGCPRCEVGHVPEAGTRAQAARIVANRSRLSEQEIIDGGVAFVMGEASTPEPAGTRLVIVESPYAGDIARNVAYARAAMADCLRRGEAPIASHLLYTQPGVLRDNVPEERNHGIEAGLAWGRVADGHVFYVDLGWSRGMTAARDRCEAEGRKWETRALLGEWASPAPVATPAPEVRALVEEARRLLGILDEGQVFRAHGGAWTGRGRVAVSNLAAALAACGSKE